MKLKAVYISRYSTRVNMAFGENLEHTVTLDYDVHDPMYQKVIASLVETERLINESLEIRADSVSLTP